MPMYYRHAAVIALYGPCLYLTPGINPNESPIGSSLFFYGSRALIVGIPMQDMIENVLRDKRY